MRGGLALLFFLGAIWGTGCRRDTTPVTDVTATRVQRAWEWRRPPGDRGQWRCSWTSRPFSRQRPPSPRTRRFERTCHYPPPSHQTASWRCAAWMERGTSSLSLRIL